MEASVGFRDVEAQAQVAPQVSPCMAAADGESCSSSAECPAQSGCSGALCGLLTPGQRLYCALAALVELVLVWLWQQDVTFSPANNSCIYSIAHLMLVSLYPRAPRAAQSPVASQAAPAGQRGAGMVAAGGLGGGGKARSFFLDGVKIFVTQLVLVHHISIGGGGWAFALDQYPGSTFGKFLISWLFIPNESWFMCILFFVGGIFVPSSLERKGLAEFVRDKLRRLGWPLVVTYFVVTPLQYGLWGVVFCGGGALSYMMFNEAVTWFLAPLLILSVSYPILPFPQVSIPMPSAVQVISVCAALGALQGWIYYCQFSLFNIFPFPMGALPFDVAFFAAGCVAKRSGWLGDIQSMAPRDYWLARLAALITVVSTGVVTSTIGSRPDEVLSPSLRLGPRLLFGVWMGVMTGGISVSVLHFFAVHCNSPSRFQKLAGESQYAVYVLQTVVISGVMFTLVLILRAAGYAVEFECSNGSLSSSSDLPEWVIVGGWIYTVVLVTVISWPLGYLFRKLPFVKDVL